MKFSKNQFNIFILYLVVVICIAPIIYGFYYIKSYAVDVPQWDQWDTIVVWTIQHYEGNFNLGSLIAPQNDSRPILPSALMLIGSILTNMNIKIMFYLGYIIYICSIIVIIYFLKKDVNLDIMTLILLIPLVYYAFNPYYMMRFIYNTGSVQYPILILTASMTIYLIDLSRDSYKIFFGSIFMGVMCTFSFAAGLSIWFAGLFQLVIQETNNKLSKIAIWIMSAILVFYINYELLGFPSAGIHSTSAYSSMLDALRNYPIQKFLCFMGTLGSQVIHQNEIALFFGLIISAFFFSLLYINRHCLELDRTSKLYSLLAFGTLTSLQVALTRSGLDLYVGSAKNIFFIPHFRHSLAIFLPIICIYVLSIFYTKNSVTQEKMHNSSNFLLFFRERKYINLFLLGIIFILLSLGFILHFLPGIDGGKSQHIGGVAMQYYLENYQIQPDINLEKLHPHASVVRERAAKLEKYKLNVFAKDGININEYSKFNVGTYSYIDRLNQKAIHLQTGSIVIDKVNEDTFDITGWAVDKHANSPAKAVFITIGDELNIPTIYGLDRPDVAKAYDNKNFRYSGFRASFASSILDEGPHNFTIKIVSKEGDGYYTSNQIVPFIIV